MRSSSFTLLVVSALASISCGGGAGSSSTGAGGAGGAHTSTGAWPVGSSGATNGATTGSSGGPATTSSTTSGSSTTGATGSSGFPPPAEDGRATYYDADGSGNCGFDPSPNDLDVTAMDMPEYAGSAVCGECVHVMGPNGAVTVRVVDSCPGCEKGHLDLSQQAFAKIADLAAGNVPITWAVVPCAVSGNVAYRFKEGSSQYWTAIQVRNHKLPIASLAWMHNGAWEDVPRQDYNYFVVASGVGTTGPFDVKITAADGQVLMDTLAGVGDGVVVQGSGQFQ